jgi:hypothetical protein
MSSAHSPVIGPGCRWEMSERRGQMAATEAEGAGTGMTRLKAYGPAAGAVGIIAAIVGISVMAAPASDAPAPATPAPAAVEAPPPSSPEPIPGLVTPQQNQPGGAGAMQTGIEIVVKFKDDSRVKDIIDAFWRDQASGRAKFDAWKASRPEFAKLRLDRVTYSNELVLVHDGSVPAAERVPAMRAIVTKLGAVADISYAEPNMTAHPGGQ